MHLGTSLMCHCEERSDVAISGRQLRFRREYHVIQPGSARFPRRFAPRNDKLGGIARSPGMPPYLQLPMALNPRKGDAASVRRQSRQRLRSERRYRRYWFVRFYRYPIRIVGAPPHYLMCHCEEQSDVAISGRHFQFVQGVDKNAPTDCVCSGAPCAAVGGFAALRMRRAPCG